MGRLVCIWQFKDGKWDILEWFFNTVLEFFPWMLWTQKKAKSNSKPQASFQEVSMFCRRQLFSDAIVDALIRNIVSNWHLGRSRWKEDIYKKKKNYKPLCRDDKSWLMKGNKYILSPIHMRTIEWKIDFDQLSFFNAK